MVRESGPIVKNTSAPEEKTPEIIKAQILKKEPLVRGLCRRRLASAGRIDMVDAIINDVLYKSIKHVDENPPIGNLDAWLTTITINTINTYLRDIKNEPADTQKAMEIWDMDINDPNPNVEETLIDKEQEELKLKALYEAIEKLPEMRRKYLKMNLEGMEATEIARKLGHNKNTVSRTITDARKNLAKNLGQSTDFKWKKSGRKQK